MSGNEAERGDWDRSFDFDALTEEELESLRREIEREFAGDMGADALNQLDYEAKKQLQRDIADSKEAIELMDKASMLKYLNKGKKLLQMPESFKRLLWKAPSLLGVCKDVLDGLKRGLPTSYFNDEIIATTGRFTQVRFGKLITDLELTPSIALASIADNKAPVIRAKESSGNGDFILAVDISGSMSNKFSEDISFFDLAKTIAICLYTMKKTHIYGWGSYANVFENDVAFANLDEPNHGSTNISACCRGLVELTQVLKLNGSWKRGTDLVIITDGIPSEQDCMESRKIQELVESNKGCVWLIDLIGKDSSRRTIPDGWANLTKSYIPVKTIDDIQSIVPIMKKALRKIK